MLKNLKNDLEIWEMANIFGKWLRYMWHVLTIWESAQLSWKSKNLTKGLDMWEMTKNLWIGLSVWETAKICGKWRRSAEKWLKYVGKWLNYLTKYLKNVKNDLEIWEMAKIFGKWLRCMGHGLSIWKTA